MSGPGEAGRTRFVSRAYARLWSGQAASSLGDAVFTVSAVLWVDRDLAAGRPGAAAAVSGVTAAAYAAVAVAGPAAGMVVDRFDRRTVMAATELARAGLAGGLAALAFAPAGLIPPVAWLAVLYAVVFALNAAGQFFEPARMAVIAALVPGDADRARAAGLAEAAAAGASTVGPLIAAPLMLAVGIRAALVVNAVSYLASWASVRALPPSRPARDGQRPGFVAGVRAFASSRYLTRLLPVTLLCQLGAGVLSALNVVAVTCDLHGTAGTYGAAEALMGAGYVAGAAAAGCLVRAAGPRAVTCGGLFAAAALTAGYALARDPATGLPLLAAYAAAIGVLNTSVAPYLLGSVADAYLGRVLALWMPVNQAAGAVSMLAAGWLASSILRGFSGAGLGPVSLLLLAGAVLITTAGVWAAAALPRGPPTEPAAPVPSLPRETGGRHPVRIDNSKKRPVLAPVVPVRAMLVASGRLAGLVQSSDLVMTCITRVSAVRQTGTAPARRRGNARPAGHDGKLTRACTHHHAEARKAQEKRKAPTTGGQLTTTAYASVRDLRPRCGSQPRRSGPKSPDEDRFVGTTLTRRTSSSTTPRADTPQSFARRAAEADSRRQSGHGLAPFAGAPDRRRALPHPLSRATRRPGSLVADSDSARIACHERSDACGQAPGRRQAVEGRPPYPLHPVPGRAVRDDHRGRGRGRLRQPQRLRRGPGRPSAPGRTVPASRRAAAALGLTPRAVRSNERNCPGTTPETRTPRLGRGAAELNTGLAVLAAKLDASLLHHHRPRQRAAKVTPPLPRAMRPSTCPKPGRFR